MSKINSFSPIIKLTHESIQNPRPVNVPTGCFGAQQPLVLPLGDKEIKLSDLNNRGLSTKTSLNNLFDNSIQPNTIESKTNSTLVGISPANQELLKQFVTKHKANAQDVNTLTRLSQATGFGKLTADEQKRLINFVGGTNQELSQGARANLRKTLDNPKTDQTTPETFRSFLGDKNNLPYVISQNIKPGEFDNRRARFTIVGPEEVKDVAFVSGKADAQKYVVETNGRKIPVFVGKNRDPKENYHSIEEVAKGLSSLPKVSLDKVVSIRVDSKPNPSDVFWAKQYGMPEFRSYMTAGADGKISIYPAKFRQTQSVLDGSLIHETGHTLSKQLFGENTNNKVGDAKLQALGKMTWTDWRQAMQKDGISPSVYAFQSAQKGASDEDFAETLTLYAKVKNTPQESEIRQIMPERFGLLDRITK